MLLKDTVLIAYKKLKSYVYNENFSLSLRVKLADYEAEGIESNLKKLTEKLSKFKNGDTIEIDNLIKSIGVNVLPKSFSDSQTQSSPNDLFYSNKNKRDVYHIERITPFIDCSIELHIISIIWIMRIGESLDSELGDYCYGNRLYRNEDQAIESNSIKLFKKYYVNYTAWRDKGIKKAKDLHKLSMDVTILGLDLKNYYNTIDFDLDSILIPKGFNWVNDILKRIHLKYQRLLKSKKLVDGNQRLLPIGLISSSILANYYLREFDQYVVSEIKPAFYGRYVDDIIFVFANSTVEHENPKAKDIFIRNYLVNHKSKSKKFFKKINNSSYTIDINGNNLLFQPQKVKLFSFLATEAINLLDEFEKEIKQTSSEFKFEPETQDIVGSFESASFKISYSDTINKLRSVDGLSADKLGASKHLSKLINATKTSNFVDTKIKDEVNKQIRSYFTGKRGLELNALWEKVFTFYIINNEVTSIIDFAKDQIESILKINRSKKSEVTELKTLSEIRTNLLYHLADSLAMASSLNILFFDDAILRQIRELNQKDHINTYLNFLTFDYIQQRAKNLIQANLCRQHLIYYPLINYCKQSGNFNFLSKHLHEDQVNYEFDLIKIKYSPRFIHYNEFCLFHHFKNLFQNTPSSVDKTYKNVFDDFIKNNSLSRYRKKYEHAFPVLTPFASKKNNSEGIRISIQSKRKVDKLKVGIVNLKVDSLNSINSMKNKPNLEFQRFDQINHVLNESIGKQKADLIIFPEISIPYQWLPHLTAFSKKHQIAIICGLEHITNSAKNVFNYVVTVLPFSYKGYKNSLVDFRLKKDYSPSEVQQIEGWKHKIPHTFKSIEKLRLYNWRNMQFGVLNCFELTDIRKRAIYRGYVDFMCTIEYNHDVNYFSNITESIARDIHAYIIQVNTSDYGDSRITQPAESNRKDILKIKGGNNISLTTDTISIENLREFQKMNYTLQEKSKLFKFTPPNFVQKR